jgi:hypothetical protein
MVPTIMYRQTNGIVSIREKKYNKKGGLIQNIIGRLLKINRDNYLYLLEEASCKKQLHIFISIKIDIIDILLLYL